MAKLSRESRLRERRLEKQARKEARRNGDTTLPMQEQWLGPERPSPADTPASDPGVE